MRQYRIIYQRLGGKPSALQPHVHAALYDRPEVNAAIQHIRVNPHVDGMALLLDGGERFNIMAFTQDAEAPNAFPFGEAPVDAT